MLGHLGQLETLMLRWSLRTKEQRSRSTCSPAHILAGHPDTGLTMDLQGALSFQDSFTTLPTTSPEKALVLSPESYRTVTGGSVQWFLWEPWALASTHFLC